MTDGEVATNALRAESLYPTRLIVIFDAVTAEGGPTNPSMYPNLSLASDTAEPTSSSWSC